MYDGVYRVKANALYLRAQPGRNAAALVLLKRGQAVVRMDQTNWGAGREWWYVFADTPGAGVFVGYVHSGFLERWDLDPSALSQSGFAAPGDTASPDDFDPPREPDADAPGMLDSWVDGWNPAVPAERRYTGRCNNRPSGARVSRVVVHITGTRSLPQVVNRFTTGKASAHYVIDFDGLIHQFVPEDKRAWHAGIPAHIKRLYNRGDGSWRKYKQFFSWSRDYANNAVYLDASLKPVSRDSGNAALAALPDGADWSDYAYFDERWGRRALPIGFEESQDPNANTIGIEVLSMGYHEHSSSEYTDAMYASLSGLVADICVRHGIERVLGPVCGHEDVNPIGRWGWDPNQGFDWSRALSGGAMS